MFLTCACSTVQGWRALQEAECVFPTIDRREIGGPNVFIVALVAVISAVVASLLLRRYIMI